MNWTWLAVTIAALIAALIALAVWAGERQRRLHIHQWKPAGAQPRTITGVAAIAASAEQTVVIQGCACGQVDTTIIDGTWTTGQVRAAAAGQAVPDAPPVAAEAGRA